MEIEAKLGLNAFKLDNQPHILIDHQVCQAKCRQRPCLYVCPARLYSVDSEGKIQVDWEGCLECGTCLVACRDEALSWFYPRAGRGVHYRFG